ncbi:MAG: Transcription_WhiB, partial [uncultured Frankineae bacterium]
DERADPPGRPGGRRRRSAGLAGAGAVRPDRPRGVLPGEGRVDEGGQAHLRRLRGQGRVPGVRPGSGRALRHLGRDVRAGAPAPQARSGL